MRETHIKVSSDVTIGLITDLLEKHFEELGYSIKNIEDVKLEFAEAIKNRSRKGDPVRSSRGGSVSRSRGTGSSRPTYDARPAGGGKPGRPGRPGSPGYDSGRPESYSRPGGGGSVRDFIGENTFLTVELSDNVKKRVSEEFYEDIIKKINEPLPDTSGDVLVDLVEVSEENAVAIFEDVANDLPVTTEEIANEFAENVGLSDGGKL